MVRKYERNWQTNDRQYKIIPVPVPDSNVMIYYVYHYSLGVSATFNSINEARYWMNGFDPVMDRVKRSFRRY